jgi:AraC-like DNA-binding protein
MDNGFIISSEVNLIFAPSIQNNHMLNKDSIYVILFSLPVYQLLFYTVQLVSFKRKNPSKRYLGLLLLCMTTFLVINAVHFLGYNKVYVDLYILYLPVLLSIAPAYFLYILSITRENHDVKRKEKLLLFSPAIILLLANIVLFLFTARVDRLAMIVHDEMKEVAGAGSISGLLLGFWIASVLLVFAQIIFAIARVSKLMLAEAEHMRQQPSHLAYLEWRWILGISFSTLIFLVINSLLEMIVPISNMGIVVVYNLLMLVAGGMLGFLGMKQDTLLNQVEKLAGAEKQFTPEKTVETVPAEKESTSASFIAEKEADELQSLIIQYLESEKPYIRSDFSMHELCDRLNVSRRKVSYVLNEVMQKNFYGVINEYRIKEAETLLLKDDLNLMKIEVFGEMVGFQSKSSFNACFKKITGMTPSEYRAKKKTA